MKKFPWGKIIRTHEIGEYLIHEYHPNIYVNSCSIGKVDETKTSFHPFIGMKDTNHSYSSLDSALIGAICLKHDGINTHAQGYIERMLNMRGEP